MLHLPNGLAAAAGDPAPVVPLGLGELAHAEDAHARGPLQGELRRHVAVVAGAREGREDGLWRERRQRLRAVLGREDAEAPARRLPVRGHERDAPEVVWGGRVAGAEVAAVVGRVRGVAEGVAAGREAEFGLGAAVAGAASGVARGGLAEVPERAPVGAEDLCVVVPLAAGALAHGHGDHVQGLGHLEGHLGALVAARARDLDQPRSVFHGVQYGHGARGRGAVGGAHAEAPVPRPPRGVRRPRAHGVVAVRARDHAVGAGREAEGVGGLAVLGRAARPRGGAVARRPERVAGGREDVRAV